MFKGMISLFVSMCLVAVMSTSASAFFGGSGIRVGFSVDCLEIIKGVRGAPLFDTIVECTLTYSEVWTRCFNQGGNAESEGNPHQVSATAGGAQAGVDFEIEKGKADSKQTIEDDQLLANAGIGAECPNQNWTKAASLIHIDEVDIVQYDNTASGGTCTLDDRSGCGAVDEIHVECWMPDDSGRIPPDPNVDQDEQVDNGFESGNFYTCLDR